MVRVLLLRTGTKAEADPTLRNKFGAVPLMFGSSVYFPGISLGTKDEECKKLLEGPTMEWETSNHEHSLLGVPTLTQEQLNLLKER